MGFPQTLSGLIGFTIFLAFLLGIVLPNLNSQEASHIQTLQSNFNTNLNNTITSNQTAEVKGFWGFVGTATGTNGVLDFLTGFFQVGISFIQLVLAYLGIFATAILNLPPVFLVFIALVSSALIIQVIKLIFLSGD